jgi:phosphate transport system substrate-binding protein
MTRNIIRVTMAVTLLAGLAPAEVLINGAGASFPYPMYSKWFDSYHKKFKDLNFNYQSIGSSGGIKNVTEGTVDFGASDGPMSDDQLKAYKGKHGFGILHFPTVLGAVVPIYNVPGVSSQLNFTGEALAGIFLGKITKWNDPEVAKANPGVNLPANNIVVVHRAEGSGTTYVWTDFLSKVSPDWKTKVGTMASPNWPVGLGAKESAGVAGQVKQLPNALGYVELIYAIQNKISYGKVKNAGGAFIQADLASVTAAARAPKEMPEDFRVSITNADGKDAYPISTFTWLLIPEKIADGQKKKAIVDFLKWMLTEGQSQTEALDYAKLPKPVVDKETKAIAKIQ